MVSSPFNSCCSYSVVQHDTGDGNLKGYMMAGSRVDYSNELGEPVSNIYAISTTDRQVVDTIQVGYVLEQKARRQQS